MTEPLPKNVDAETSKRPEASSATIIVAALFGLAVVVGGVLYLVSGRDDHGDVEATYAEIEASEVAERHRQTLVAELAAAKKRAEVEYRSLLEVRLREHEAKLKLARHDLADDVASFFEARKEAFRPSPRRR